MSKHTTIPSKSADKLNSHPAIEAWLALDANNARPKTVEALYAGGRENRDKQKSAAYKLSGVGHAGSSVVAKRCCIDTARIERIIYEKILPKLPITSLRYYGFAEYSDFCWLFIEYTSGVEWNGEDNAHLDSAIRWMASMHGCSAQIDELSLLPERGPHYYRSRLAETVNRAQEATSNTALSPDGINIMNGIHACSALLTPHWPEIHSLCESMPVSLVHNDFIKKNIHVRSANSGLMLLPFDWEMSGRGTPAVDLYWMHKKSPEGTIQRYWEYLREFHDEIDIKLHEVEKLTKLGVIFRYIQALEWASYSFSFNTYKRIINAKIYTDRINCVLNDLGWA